MIEKRDPWQQVEQGFCLEAITEMVNQKAENVSNEFS